MLALLLLQYLLSKELLSRNSATDLFIWPGGPWRQVGLKCHG